MTNRILCHGKVNLAPQQIGCCPTTNRILCDNNESNLVPRQNESLATTSRISCPQQIESCATTNTHNRNHIWNQNREPKPKLDCDLTAKTNFALEFIFKSNTDMRKRIGNSIRKPISELNYEVKSQTQCRNWIWHSRQKQNRNYIEKSTRTPVS